MAPDPPDQKRKRGRPAAAPKLPQDASNRDAQGDNDADHAEDESRPRKRGRKAEKSTAVSSGTSDVENETVGRRGRPSKKQQQEQTQVGASENAPEHKRIAKKPSNTSKETAKPSKAKGRSVSAADETPSSEPRRSGRERRPWNPDEVYGAKRANASQDGSSPSDPSHRQTRAAPESEPPTLTSRRSGRQPSARDPGEASKHAQPNNESETATTQVTKKPKSKKRVKDTQKEANVPEQGPPDDRGVEGKRRRGRPSLNTQHSVAGASGDGPPTRRGHSKTSAPTTQETNTGGPSGSRAIRREEGSNIVKKSRQTKQAPPQPRRGEVRVEEDASGSSEEESELPFRHLEEVTRNIPRSTVAAKWSPLDAPSINTVSSFLADAQRPVLFRLQNTNRRREHASAAMGVVSRRLRAKLIKGFPFPAPIVGASSRANSRSYEDEFDFERTVDTMQNLENTLNPLLHSVSLLEKEIKKQEDALAKDYHALHKLENNARSKTKEWRETAKREHALAPGVKRRDQGLHREHGDQLELVPPVEDGLVGSLFSDPQDEELTMLSRQIGSHMESLRGNLQQIGGVVPAITKSKAALQQVLLKHLDDEQYDGVLLGHK